MKAIIERLKGLRWAADKQRNGTAQGCENAFEVLDGGIEGLIADVENPEPKKIPLSKGKYALVDAEDYHYLSRFSWHLHDDARGHLSAQRLVEARTKGTKNFHLKMSDMIIGTGKGKTLIAHKNRDTLDYRKENLVVTSWHATRHNQVGANRKNKRSKYRGVGFKLNCTTRPWCMMIQKDGKKFSSYHATEVEAAEAYNEKARELYGVMAYQNDV